MFTLLAEAPAWSEHPATGPSARARKASGQALLSCWNAGADSRSSVPPQRTFAYWTLLLRQDTDRGGLLVRIVASVEIDRPASQVWAYVADSGHDPSWRGGVTQMRPSQAGPAQEGVTTHERLRLWV
jgi:Polyketide cyclase / dehydrase and lipid transport